MVDTRNARFFRWYRVLPLLLVAFSLALSLGIDYLPTNLVRSLFFPVSYAERIDDASERHGVDPHLVAAIIRCESGWNENAQSDVGAIGLMQVMPDTAQTIAGMGLVDTNHYDPQNLTDPATNIEYGTALVAYLQSQLSSTDEVIAAYNAGIGTVQGWLQNTSAASIEDAITYPETRHYLNHVREAMRQYEQFYPNGMSAL